ncbi:beta-lactamase/transpeptidase-like protein [Stereum hirsutum FP-91666 SS1]|uniref:beta-lactamase/transpeptidase-like protein n=1 Tax=Stereum hirsutum (strain FP-91666) TaxID=721885 RepID=UPI000440DAEA|nr:beta-lactamase/transpeptidase-like protein [Stereum hirsutum FP-91666 SS1]EIM90648.1 beta-lactamase/transpeptidase-like protein [Stereum hirsutum FP-91666 SS1]
MNDEMLRSLQFECDRLLDAKFGETGLPGAQFIALSRNGTTLYSRSLGTKAINSAEPMTDDTMFWMASCTKILTSMCILKCVEKGLVTLDEDILGHIPELAKQLVRQDTTEPGKFDLVPRKGPITLRMLMTFTSGVAFPSTDLTPEVIEFIATSMEPYVQARVEFHGGGPLNSQPGEKWEYGGALEWAGLVVESITGQKLGDFMKEQILEPCGVHDINFELTEDQRSRFTGTHFRWPDGRVTVRGKLISDDVVDHVGGSGLYGRGDEYARALLPLVNDGVHPFTGKRILKPETVKSIFEGQLTPDQAAWLERPTIAAGGKVLFPNIEKQWGMGCLLMPKGSSVTGRGERTGTWEGWANTHWMADPTKGVVMVVFAQVVPNTDEKLVALKDEWEKTVYQGYDLFVKGGA